MSRKQHDTYWWNEKDPKEVVKRLAPFNKQGKGGSSHPLASVWSRNMLIYFSNLIKPNQADTGLIYEGSQGETIDMLVPMARSLVRQLVQIITKQRLNFQCLAETTSQNVIETTRLGNAICKQVVRDQGLDLKYEMAVEHEFLTGMSFLYVRWRTDRGDFWGEDAGGKKHYKGDIEISAPTVWDVSFDYRIPNPDNWNWVQVREIENRWDLVAQHPTLKEEILKLPSIDRDDSSFTGGTDAGPGQEDLVYVWAAYHIKAPAVDIYQKGGGGRYIAYASDTCVFYDGPNIYGELPCYASRAEPLPGLSLGYPFFCNLIQTQEMFDTCISAAATNSATFGIQNITAPRGANVTPSNLLGMTLLTYTPMQIQGGGKPEPLQLTKTAPETFKLMEYCLEYLREMSQVNSALRGEPPSQVSSGTAIATLTASALEAITAGAKSSRLMLRRAMRGSIRSYQRMASVERDVKFSSIGGQSYSKKFIGADLDGIQDIDLTEANPLMQTLSGRIEIGREVVSQGLVKNLKGYFAVLEGAPPQELYKNELSEEDLMNRENESLLSGEPVMTTNADDHPLHMSHHAMLLNDPKVRLNGARNAAIMQHILEHFEAAKGIDPMFAAMIRTGKMPEMGMEPPGGAQGVGGGRPQQRAGAVGKPQPPEAEEDVAEPADPADDLLNRE